MERSRKQFRQFITDMDLAGLTGLISRKPASDTDHQLVEWNKHQQNASGEHHENEVQDDSPDDNPQLFDGL